MALKIGETRSGDGGGGEEKKSARLAVLGNNPFNLEVQLPTEKEGREREAARKR